MRMTKRVAGSLAAMLAVTALAGCGSAAQDKASETRFALGTVITLTAYGAGANDAVGSAFSRIQRIENEMSVRIQDSQIAVLNKNGVNTLSGDVYALVKKAVDIAQKSGGAFDPTVLPLALLWGFDTDDVKQAVPASDKIEKARALVDYKKVGLDDENRKVTLPDGMGIDLGGIAKGYAADETWRIFREQGVKNALLDLGGNIVALGERPDGGAWRIGIRDPRAEGEGAYYAVLSVSDRAVVTSGDYERYFIENGKRYHHIFDPATGYPSESGVISATIVADNSTLADGLSTAVFVLGVEKGLALVNAMDGVDALIVTADKKVYATDGIKDAVEIVSGEYALQ